MKILIINFDVVMKDCIRLYQAYIDALGNALISWERLEHDLGLEKFLCVSQDSLFAVIKAIKFLKTTGTPIRFLNDPCQIPALLNHDESIDLTNIGFFHGIYDGGGAGVRDFEEYDIKTWVGYMAFHQNLSSYTWGRLPTSPDFADAENFGVNFTIQSYREAFDSIEAVHYDQCIVCFSERYIPYRFHFIWEMIKIMFDKEST